MGEQTSVLARLLARWPEASYGELVSLWGTTWQTWRHLRSARRQPHAARLLPSVWERQLEQLYGELVGIHRWDGASVRPSRVHVAHRFMEFGLALTSADSTPRREMLARVLTHSFEPTVFADPRTQKCWSLAPRLEEPELRQLLEVAQPNGPLMDRGKMAVFVCKSLEAMSLVHCGTVDSKSQIGAVLTELGRHMIVLTADRSHDDGE